MSKPGDSSVYWASAIVTRAGRCYVAFVFMFVSHGQSALSQFPIRWLEHYLHASDNFIELIVSELAIRFAEVGPSMDVVDHQLEIVAADVIIEASCD